MPQVLTDNYWCCFCRCCFGYCCCYFSDSYISCAFSVLIFVVFVFGIETCARRGSQLRFWHSTDGPNQKQWRSQLNCVWPHRRRVARVEFGCSAALSLVLRSAVSANSGCYASVGPLLRSAAQTTTGCLAIATCALRVIRSSCRQQAPRRSGKRECRQSVDGGLSGRWPRRQAGRAAAAAVAQQAGEHEQACRLFITFVLVSQFCGC